MVKKIFISLTVMLLFGLQVSFAQDKKNGKDVPELEGMQKITGIDDRAGGTHNASNIGLFFENRGKLYPRRITQGPSGEWPINSGKHYIYRINPMVGVKGNVIQGREPNYEEWEAVYGYHGDGAKIAFSDDPSTWPKTGWPIKDAQGNAVILSDQDSYCLYSDSLNRIKMLGITIAQTGYAYGIKSAQNLLFFKYDIINTSNTDYNDLYFALDNDIDVGNVSGGLPEYNDDKVGFDKQKNFMWFYDSKGYSKEWTDKTTGYFGVSFLKTPHINGVEAGITDFHYYLYDKYQNVDTLQYGIMSSSSSLYNSPTGADFFHLGSQPNIHFDDTSTIPAAGLDIAAFLSSGPYTLKRGDTLTFYTAIIAGVTMPETYANYELAKKMVESGFQLIKPPVVPKLSGFAANRANVLYWNDKAEQSKNSLTGQYDFEGYRVYRSIDQGVHWSLLEDFDLKNGIGLNRGIQNTFVDTNVVNGYEYWYSITAYSRADSNSPSMESPIAKNSSANNFITLIPNSPAAGRVPVGFKQYTHTWGVSNYNLSITPPDNDALSTASYTLGYSLQPKTDLGKLTTQIIPVIGDSSTVIPTRVGVIFKSVVPYVVDIVDLDADTNLVSDKSYVPKSTNQVYSVYGSRFRIKILDSANTTAEFLPQKGDMISLNLATHVIKNNTDTVLYPRPYLVGKPTATSDGITITSTAPDPVKSVSRIGGTDKLSIKFMIGDALLLKNKMYFVTVTRNAKDATGKVFITLQVDTVIGKPAVALLDTIYTLSSIAFDGVKATVEFSEAAPPAAGNAYSVETIIPKAPSYRDKFSFTLEGSKFERDKVSQQMRNIKVVPNPYVVSSSFEPEYGELRKEPLRQIKFINLPGECTIYIFTLDANLIKTLHHNAQHGTATWDLRAEGGREAAPGMYIYVVKSSDGEFKERFAIIR